MNTRMKDLKLNSKLFVDEEAKVCACRIYQVYYEYKDRKGNTRYEQSPFASAKVTCREGDTFDAEKGKQMAYAKAMARASEKINRMIEQNKKRYIALASECDADIEHNNSVKDYYEDEYNKLAQ